MRVISLFFFVALVSCSGTSVFSDKGWVDSLIELIELDYADHCEQIAAAAWDELLGVNGALQTKIERDKAFGHFSQRQSKEIRDNLEINPLQSGEDILKRKVKLLLEPGDTMMDTEQWIRLVTFGDQALHRIRHATDYDCGRSTNCTLRELHNSLAGQQDEDTLRRIKSSWENKLPNLTEYCDQILPLLVNASKKNNYNSVQEYWDSLVEYEGGLLKARELWDQVKPLYIKLQKYVSLRMRGSDAVGKPLPAHLLRSLNGDDWLNIIESVLPKNPDIYQKLHANLQLKNLGGKAAFKTAAKLVEGMDFGTLEQQLWTESEFNGTCPTVLVDSCKPNIVKAFTCKDVSIGHYIEAHEAVMKIKYKEVSALHSNNTYILREANRFSAMYEAIAGFVGLLSVTPHALDRAGLYQLERFNYQNNANHHRLVLQLILALRDLPKLNYYLAADEWRLQVLNETITSPNAKKSWSEFRKAFSLVDTSDVDILGDPSVLYNKPLLGNFMGVILKYQIYNSFAEELISDGDDLIQHVTKNNHRVFDTMSKGFLNMWPETIGPILEREHTIDSTGITDYFKLLDDYLDSQLDPTNAGITNIEYEEPPEEAPAENEIPQTIRKAETEVETKTTHESIQENVIEVDESAIKHSMETSTIGVLEIKNPVTSDKDNSSTKEASYNTYWWIGVIVALAIVIVFIAIIVRKRNNHRKELDKQRREDSHA